ncbi:MAG: hypothetical protein H6909_00860 [Rickettsiaceae bacterium]|nr:hypothetical protein [Rickettsiaceae bacterium]
MTSIALLQGMLYGLSQLKGIEGESIYSKPLNAIGGAADTIRSKKLFNLFSNNNSTAEAPQIEGWKEWCSQQQREKKIPQDQVDNADTITTITENQAVNIPADNKKEEEEDTNTQTLQSEKKNTSGKNNDPISWKLTLFSLDLLAFVTLPALLDMFNNSAKTYLDDDGISLTDSIKTGVLTTVTKVTNTTYTTKEALMGFGDQGIGIILAYTLDSRVAHYFYHKIGLEHSDHNADAVIAGDVAKSVEAA